MTIPNDIVSLAKDIQDRYPLCDQCLGRLFAKKLHRKSNRLLGQRLRTRHERCYICRDTFDNLNYYLDMMIRSLQSISFSTFSIGTIIKPSFADRDDQVRSKYHLQGIDSLKSDITATLAKFFARRTRKCLDLLDPDITITINLKTTSCDVRSKYVVLGGEYLKLERNIPQRQSPCPNCSRKGCRTCNNHGINKFDSVEGFISRLVFERLGGTVAKFIWVGGEDRTSLVLARRPFYIKLCNPQRRTLESIDMITDSIHVYNLRTIPSLPKQPIQFRSTCRALVCTNDIIDSTVLQRLTTLTKQQIIVYSRSGKRKTKTIHSLRYRRRSDREFLLTIDIDGGLSIKRLITGDDVSPSVSSILGMSCHVKHIDIIGTNIIDNNNFN